MRKIVVIFIVAITFIACENNNPNKQLIVGNWQAVQWLVGNQASNNNVAGTSFNFTATDSYTYNYAGNKEEGTYKVENDMLFTKPVNQAEMMVKIVKLNKDSLVFDMNRAGQAETLVLIKK